MNIPEHYKLIYLDTNVASDICKPEGLMKKFFASFPPNENYVICFSTYTLYEVQNNAKIYAEFKKLYSIFPCVVVMSYYPLAMKEVDFIDGKTEKVEPLVFAPAGVIIDGKKLNPNSLDTVLEIPSVVEGFKSVESYTEKYFHEISNLLDHPDFLKIKSRIRNKKDVFIKKFIMYELVNRLSFDTKNQIDFTKLKKIKTLEILANCIYYKFFSDPNRKTSRNDIVDVLIMTTVPYVHTFISERNSIDILRKIKKQTDL
ncbi:MAG: hypothetical protein HRT73_16320, partial [Flavobacteriales bacterium]|nr:hypothetical protein [Flavobacteriales bacterium]